MIILGSLADTVWSVCNSNKWCNCCCPESLYDDWCFAWLIVVQWFCQQQYNISSYPLLFLFQVAACEMHQSVAKVGYFFNFIPRFFSLQESTTFLWSHNGKTKFCRHIYRAGKGGDQDSYTLILYKIYMAPSFPTWFVVDLLEIWKWRSVRERWASFHSKSTKRLEYVFSPTPLPFYFQFSG